MQQQVLLGMRVCEGPPVQQRFRGGCLLCMHVCAMCRLRVAALGLRACAVWRVCGAMWPVQRTQQAPCHSRRTHVLLCGACAAGAARSVRASVRAPALMCRVACTSWCVCVCLITTDLMSSPLGLGRVAVLVMVRLYARDTGARLCLCCARHTVVQHRACVIVSSNAPVKHFQGTDHPTCTPDESNARHLIGVTCHACAHAPCWPQHSVIMPDVLTTSVRRCQLIPRHL
jgi:hypothetical protein